MDSRDTGRRASSSISGDGAEKDAFHFVHDNQMVMHRKILEASQDAPEFNGGLIGIYVNEILPHKTRTIGLLGRKCSAVIIQTLLGYEVKARHKRIHCPDLVTARYLKLFSELGCRSIRLPYDPTLTARLIPVLETAYQSITATVQRIFRQDPGRRQYVIRKIYAIVRDKLRSAS